MNNKIAYLVVYFAPPVREADSTASHLITRQSLAMVNTRGFRNWCRLSWMTNSALLYEPKCGGRGEVAESSANEYSCKPGAQINFGDITFGKH